MAIVMAGNSIKFNKRASPSKIKIRYDYNGQNRMVYSEVTNHVERTHTVNSYAYDALGRRTLTQSVTGQTMRTVYDGRGFEVIREGETFRDGSLTTRFATGATSTNRGEIQSNQPTGERYRWIGDDVNVKQLAEDGYAVQSTRYEGRGVTLYGNGEAVAVSYSSSTSSRSVYLGKDIMGSVRTSTTDGGNIEERYEYDAFGQPYKGDLDGMMNLGYMSKPFDSATGMYNYGYRDYRPQAARFTTVDPIRDGSNWFVYVNNDPINYIDILGLCASDAKNKWIDNGDGTYTALPGATLWDLYGNNWQEQSGFDRDPRTLQVGETVGQPSPPPPSTGTQSYGQTQGDAGYVQSPIQTVPNNQSGGLTDRQKDVLIGSGQMLIGGVVIVGGFFLMKYGFVCTGYFVMTSGITLGTYGFARAAGGNPKSPSKDVASSFTPPAITVFSNVLEFLRR